MSRYTEMCKECIHYQMCHSIDIDAPCAAYKNKTYMVEVVRCKDCVFRLKDDVGRAYCDLGDFYVGDTDYCSRGERRDE